MSLEELRRAYIEEKYLKGKLVSEDGSWNWNEDGTIDIVTSREIIAMDEEQRKRFKFGEPSPFKLRKVKCGNDEEYHLRTEKREISVYGYAMSHGEWIKNNCK